MLKVGLIGLGYLGKIHLKCLKEINDLEFVGIFDIDTETKKSLADQYNIKAFESMQDLIDACDVVDIVTPSQTHFEIAKACIRKGKHVFIEKPVTPTVEEAKALQVLAEEAGIKIQVGHVERFNPAFIAAKPYIKNPQFIEIHRLAQYNPRGTDVSVTLDLMIHDLDLLLSIVGSNIKKISASGVNIVSPTVDMVNARIEFDNGCVANVTSNRVSLKNMRKFRIFQENSLVSINLLEKVTELIHVKNASKDSKNLILKPGNNLPDKELIFEHPIILPSNAIKEELSAFIACIAYKQKPVVGIENAIDVLSLAYAIDEKISHVRAK
jgi:predicted dehydrogenase